MSLPSYPHAEKRIKLFAGICAFVFVVLVGLGVMGSNGWLPSTDPMSGKRTGWFGSESSPPYKGGVDAFRGRGGSLLPPPTPTPQLSKEYIYAGSRLLAVEDANANAAPPADLAVWRPSEGTWWVLGGPGSQQTVQQWGLTGDIAVPGDYDGDGKTDFSVFRPSTGEWYVINSGSGSSSIWQWGLASDIPAPADFDGDGKTDRAVWRPSDGTWSIVRSSDQTVIYTQFGLSTDIPAPADYDGDGKADITVWRTSDTKFYSIRSSDITVQIILLGLTGTPVPGDYDGDGKADYAVKSGSDWIIRNSATSATSVTTWQLAGDNPVQNDYDADGKVDIATWRDSNGNWYIRQSGSGNSLRQVQWGQSGDIPVPAFYRR